MAAAALEDGVLIGAVLDTAELLDAHRSLRETEERLGLGMQAARMRAWDWDLDRDKVTWLHPGDHVSGPTPTDWASSRSAIHAEDVDPAAAEIERARSAGTAFELEFRWKT